MADLDQPTASHIPAVARWWIYVFSAVWNACFLAGAALYDYEPWLIILDAGLTTFANLLAATNTPRTQPG